MLGRVLAVPLSVAVAAAPSAAQAGAGRCLGYEPDTVVVTGVLERRTFYGAPSFGEDPRTDERETGFYLRLAAPVCARPGAGQDPGEDAAVQPRDGVRLVQLVLDSAGYARLRPRLGRRVTLRGTVFSSHTGHHHAPLLLEPLPPDGPPRPPASRARPSSRPNSAARAAASDSRASGSGTWSATTAAARDRAATRSPSR